MARIAALVFIALVVVGVAGLIVTGIYRAREDQEMRRCQNNLRQIGEFGLLHSALPGKPVPFQANVYFPSGTLVNDKLPYDERLSWYVLVLAAVEQGPVEAGAKANKPLSHAEALANIDSSKPWNAEVHQSLAHTRLPVFICPAQAPESGGGPALTNYLGNGGIGPETAALTVEAAGKRAGVFRYNTPTPLELIRDGDGLAHTISIVETARGIGPWLQGGPATVRSLDPDEAPYLGPGRLYAGCHRNRGNFAVADGSVRVLTDRIDPVVFRALLTIRGGESEVDFNDH